MEIKLLFVKETKGERFTSPWTLANFMDAESKADRECLWVIHLNGVNRIIEKELAGMGVIDQAVVRPATIMRKAVLLNTAQIVIVHNHPTGNPAPSNEDKEVCRLLRNAGEILGIVLLDFIIIAQGKYFSFKEQNIQ